MKYLVQRKFKLNKIDYKGFGIIDCGRWKYFICRFCIIYKHSLDCLILAASTSRLKVLKYFVKNNLYVIENCGYIGSLNERGWYFLFRFCTYILY